ncbi:hypothetical protein RM530_11290 [Algiphilus sp. W345]|uniref:Uncharacterized protein n=1 Tax=Banduia mediterranea TaxID=3075609 RepID=A0ABU2WKX5_9GAMM|nr:hypothetical protein [Algiphilus sp. W345]MDT0497941.1 hypothetical protein [Algiphilus sp. W345]
MFDVSTLITTIAVNLLIAALGLYGGGMLRLRRALYAGLSLWSAPYPARGPSACFWAYR